MWVCRCQRAHRASEGFRLRQGSRRPKSRTALRNNVPKQSGRERRGHEQRGVDRAGRLAKQGDVVRSAAELSDVSFYPGKCCELVQQSIISGTVMCRFFAELGVTK